MLILCGEPVLGAPVHFGRNPIPIERGNLRRSATEENEASDAGSGTPELNTAIDGVAPLQRRHSTMARKDSLLKLRDLLVKRRDGLRRALAGDLSNLKSLSNQNSGDVVDAALDAAQDEISSKLAEVESRELSNIEVALERMRSGAYGLCEVCNGKIPLARLSALPYATSCIECQRATESATGGVGYGGDWSRVLDGGLLDADVSFSDLEAN